MSLVKAFIHCRYLKLFIVSVFQLDISMYYLPLASCLFIFTSPRVVTMLLEHASSFQYSRDLFHHVGYPLLICGFGLGKLSPNCCKDLHDPRFQVSVKLDARAHQRKVLSRGFRSFSFSRVGLVLEFSRAATFVIFIS